MNDDAKLLNLLENAPKNSVIGDALVKCFHAVHTHDKILASVSGGSDSDVMIDMLIRCGAKEKTTFVFFNTGLEYEATKRQLEYLESKYNIEIKREPPVKPIPLCVREYGVPFWSKQVSEMIMRLQKHDFQWEDEPLEKLLQKYPHCKAALRWWCNDWAKDNGAPSPLCINWVKGLKEFLIAHPPQIKISPKCCHYSKKEPARICRESNFFDLDCTGVRKAEGGARSTKYRNCFDRSGCGADKYRPVFWFSNTDKAEYDEHYGVEHSDCYKVWGMKRTGCAGCPFGKDFETELALAREYEPKFHKAMLAVFGESYDYTRKFLEFRKRLNRE